MDGPVVQYLKDFVASTEQLPEQLQTSFASLKGFDESALQLEVAAEAALKLHLVAAAAQQKAAGDIAQAPNSKDESLIEQWRQISKLCEEKVKVANGIYDFVDSRIQELDAQLAGFDAELTTERARLGVDREVRFAEAFAAAGGDALISGGRGRGRVRALGRPPGSGSNVSKLQKIEAPLLLPSPGISTALVPVTAEGTPAGPMPVDPNEPTYCYCNQVSFGEMIACENEECAIEWFHLQCVGIDPANKPVGDWYCKECTEQRENAGKH